MLLSDLPHEIILVITDHLDDAGVNALARTHSQMYKLLNEHLYLRDMINPNETRSLAWALREDATTNKNTIQWALYAVRHLKSMPANLHHIIHVALGRAAAEGYADLVERFLRGGPKFGLMTSKNSLMRSYPSATARPRGRWHQPKL